MFSNVVLDKIGIGPSRSGNRTQYELLQETERTKVLLPIPRSAAEEKGVSLSKFFEYFHNLIYL